MYYFLRICRYKPMILFVNAIHLEKEELINYLVVKSNAPLFFLYIIGSSILLLLSYYLILYNNSRQE